MITVPLTTAVIAFLVVTVALILLAWIFSGGRRTPSNFTVPKTEDHVWRCPICGNVYIETKPEGFSKCPQCGSMNTGEESEKVDLKQKRWRQEE